MNPILCSEYGDIIEIPPSLPIPDDITAQRLHFSSQAEVVWSQEAGLHLPSHAQNYS